MSEVKTKEIVITANSGILFPHKEVWNIHGDMLIIGNFDGVCGKVHWNNSADFGWGNDFLEYAETYENNLSAIWNVIKSGNHLVVIGENNTIQYFKTLIYTIMDMGIFGDNLSDKEKHAIFNKVGYVNVTELYANEYRFANGKSGSIRKENASERIDEIVEDKIFSKISDMKFDTIIQNPPYNGSLHLDFLEKGAELLTDTGKMVIIEPATWLINIRKNGKAKKYDEIKKKLGKHIQSVVIENLNKEFGTRLYMPFATTTIDMSKEYDTIDFVCCGEHKTITNIYDCNLIGKYDTIWSILDKVTKFGDMMNSHITKADKGRDYWYAKYAELDGLDLCQLETQRSGRNYDTSIGIFQNHSLGEYLTKYSTGAWHYKENSISNTPLCGLDAGKHLTDKITDNVYGTKTELENWKHFIFSNKLPLFINIVMTIDQNNNSKEFLPWLVDKEYTDEEINTMFGFTDEEIKLIDTTIKKYERNSPWFKRYMCGKDSVSDEEIKVFIESIK